MPNRNNSKMKTSEINLRGLTLPIFWKQNYSEKHPPIASFTHSGLITLLTLDYGEVMSTEEYIEFKEKTTEIMQGGIFRDVRPVKPNIGACSTQPEKYPVAIY
ncbi:hypothetical protein MAR_003648, partial [Mya arenaria]